MTKTSLLFIILHLVLYIACFLLKNLSLFAIHFCELSILPNTVMLINELNLIHEVQNVLETEGEKNSFKQSNPRTIIGFKMFFTICFNILYS